MTVIFDPGHAAPEGPFATSPQEEADGARKPAQTGVDDAVMEAFGIAQSLFHQCASDLTRLGDRLSRGETDELKEAMVQARALRAAAQTMMDERNRVDKLRKEVGGGCGGAGSLDLDAARDEVGRRLACLRRAGGG